MVPGECVAQTDNIRSCSGAGRSGSARRGTSASGARSTEGSGTGLRARHTAVIFLVSLAGLLLEVGYTRIVSFKLYYYYVYLVLGLALLGIGSGGIVVVVFPRLRRAATDTVIAWCGIVGAAIIGIGYFVVARIPIDTVSIWDYGTKGSFKNVAILGMVCFTLFASFVGLGIIVSTILGRGGDRVGRLYFADLIGAGLGCVLAIPLIVSLGPPQVVMLAGLIFAVVGLVMAPSGVALRGIGAVRRRSRCSSVRSGSRSPTSGPRRRRPRPTTRRRPTGARCSASTPCSCPI